ncbi:MAG: PTS system mannose/fructose/sorbose family transporter subunit IID [Gemmatimonadota bacterium]
MKAFRLTLRLLLIQVLWNYRTLVGAGLAWVLLPSLKHTETGDPERLEREIRETAGIFNAHPYLCGFAAGALIRMREDGSPKEERTRFREAIRGPLGSLGDRLFWAAWLPASVLVLGVGGLMGLPPIAVVLGFLVLFNTLHLAVRYRGTRAGLELGRDVGDALRTMQITVWQERVGAVGVISVGVLLGFLASRGFRLGEPWELGAMLTTGGLALALFGAGIVVARIEWWVAAALTPGVALLLVLLGAVH